MPRAAVTPTPTAKPHPVSEFTSNGAKIAPKVGERKAQTVSTDINLFVKTGEGADAETVPGFSTTPRVYEDEMAHIAAGLTTHLNTSSAKKFKSSLKTTLGDSYFDPEPSGFSCKTEYMQIRGARIESFFEAAIGKPGVTSNNSIVKELNIAHDEAYRGRTHNFDLANTNTYWSMTRADDIEYTDGTREQGRMQTFVEVFEICRDYSPEDDTAGREFFQKQIDFIYTNKYTPNGEVNELDCETSLGLRAIDQETRQVAHMVKLASGKMSYQTADGTTIKKVVFRPLKPGESPRPGFKFDWNKNRDEDVKKHDTSWWGHCDIEAIIEAIHADMHNSKGVTEYDATTKKTRVLTRVHQLQAFAAILNFGSVYTDGTNRIRGASKTEFAGSRFDDEPSMIVFTTASGANISCPIKLTQLSQKGIGAAEKDMGAVFMANRPVKLPGDENAWTFEPNPEVQHGGPINGDFKFIPGAERTLTGTIEKTGQVVTIDPNDPSAPPITLQTADGRTVIYDPATGGVSLDGKNQGVSKGMWIGHELKKGDGLAAKRNALRKAESTGQVLNTDCDPKSPVWNGRIGAITEKTLWRSDDGLTEVVQIKIKSKFSDGPSEYGRVINKRNERGEIIGSCELEANSDFLWDDKPEIAPYIVRDGVKHWNESLVNRGMVILGDSAEAKKSQVACVARFDNLVSIIHLGLAARPEEEAASVTHKIKYVDPDTKQPVTLNFTDKAKWQEAVDKIKTRGGEIVAEPVAPTPATNTRSNWPRLRNAIMAIRRAGGRAAAAVANTTKAVAKKATCCSCTSQSSVQVADYSRP